MKTKAMAGAIIGLCLVLCLTALWRQNRQLAAAQAMNRAYQATLATLTREKEATALALESVSHSKEVIGRTLVRERKQIAQAVHDDATMADWHTQPLPAAVLGVLRPDSGGDHTPVAPGPVDGGHFGASNAR